MCLVVKGECPVVWVCCVVDPGKSRVSVGVDCSVSRPPSVPPRTLNPYYQRGRTSVQPTGRMTATLAVVSGTAVAMWYYGMRARLRHGQTSGISVQSSVIVNPAYIFDHES